MNDTELLKVIDDFITNKVYNYAIMIDGKWGCGKTHFIIHTLLPFLKEKKIAVNYISLFGIKSVDEISNMLCIQAIKDKIPLELDSRAGRVFEAVINSALRYGITKYNAEDANLDKIIKEIPKYDNNVIIFDDLERCGCNIESVLGYINSFVEHSKANVIIVANENEIGHWQLDSNQELQMLVALDNHLLVDTEDTREEIMNKAFNRGKENKQNDTLSLEKLILRRNAIFNNNSQYLRIKEKVIGKTIVYDPDLEDIFTKLTEDKIQNDEIKNVIKNCIGPLVEYSEKEQHNNIRTFQFFIEKVNAIFSVIGNRFPTLQEIIVEYCYRSCVQMMSGNSLPNWGENEFGFQSFDKNPFSMHQVMGFRFIDEFIQNGFLDNDEALAVLHQYCQKQSEEGKLRSDPYNYIQRWYESEDVAVQKWIQEIINNIKNDVYSNALYPDILYVLCQIRSYNVFVDLIDKVICEMECHLETMDPKNIVPFFREHMALDNNYSDTYQEHYSKMSTIVETKMEKGQKDECYRIIVDKNSNWVMELYKTTIKERTVHGRSFVFWIDPKEITERLDKSNNKELNEFRILIRDIYKDSTFYRNRDDDLYKLMELEKEVVCLIEKTSGEIKKQELRWLANDLKQYISMISKSSEKR